MVEMEVYRIRIIQYISVNKQSTSLTNIFSNTIFIVIREPEERFSDLVQVVNRDMKKYKSQTIPWQYWTVTGTQAEC